MTSSSQKPEDVLISLKSSMRTVLLSTVGTDGFPHAGYTPFIFDDEHVSNHHLLIFVSQLALHTRDLLANGKVSAMLISDEAESNQIFARTRVTYQCNAEVVPPEADRYNALLDRFQSTHGKMIGVLRTLPDFLLLRLVPAQGQFVMGFGQAFKLTGEKVDQFELTRSA